MLEIEFISLMLILVYVGAIAVLFLFVVMMLDIKVVEYKRDALILYFPMALFLGIIFLSEILLGIHLSFSGSMLGDSSIYLNWLSVLDSLSDLEVLGQVLYTYYFLYIKFNIFCNLIAVFFNYVINSIAKYILLNFHFIANYYTRKNIPT